MGRLTEIIVFLNSDTTTGEAGRSFYHYRPTDKDLKARKMYKKLIEKPKPTTGKVGEQLSFF